MQQITLSTVEGTYIKKRMNQAVSGLLKFTVFGFHFIMMIKLYRLYE